MKLNQITSNDELSTVVTHKMMERSNDLQFAEFYRKTGNAEYARRSPSATGGNFYSLNNYLPHNIANPDFSLVGLKILGDLVQTDQAHERRGSDIPSVRASELLNFADNLGKQFQK